LADDPTNRQELDNIKSEILAVNYDHEINKDKGPMPPFGFITEEMVNNYWAEDDQPKQGGSFWEKIGFGEPAEQRSHADEFNAFLDAKIGVLKAGNPEMKDREVSEEERKQARDIFAKTRIYSREYKQKRDAGELSKEFIDKANLQVKLQQAQFLAKLYSEKEADQNKVTDEEVDAYIKSHPEFDPAAKRDQAQQILDRAKAGEDFAALANEFSQDPGNKGPDGTMQGGLYKDVAKGRMVAPFEQAALSLQPGEVAPNLVESDFGFHIIKLERALGVDPNSQVKPDPKAPPTETYDVRHILISTGYKDPDNPTAREAPVKDFVRNKLETEKEKNVVDSLVAKNNIQVPDDFTVPELTEEQLQQMKQKPAGIPGMPPGAGPPVDDDKPADKDKGKPPPPPKKGK
jgi:parvulin-like peptidyl-prolyl isomerase